MANIVSVQDLLTRLRIETADENEDLQELLDVAEARVRQFLVVPVEKLGVTMIDDGADEEVFQPITTIIMDQFPVETADPFQILDGDGNVIDPATYYLPDRFRDGRILAKKGYAFAPGPYTITASVGLDVDPNYDTITLPIIKGAVLDLASALYYQRNPSATTESESGVSATWDGSGIPKRVLSALQPFRRMLGPV